MSREIHDSDEEILIVPEARKADCSTEFESLCALSLCHSERQLITVLGSDPIAYSVKQISLYPIQVSLDVLLLGRLD